MSTLHTADEVREVARRLIAERPDQKNPVKGENGICLYTSDEDPTHHCIAGQIAVELVGDAPGPEYEGTVLWARRMGATGPVDPAAKGWFHDHFDTDAIGVLQELQSQADKGGGITPWGQVVIPEPRAEVTL